MPIAYHKQSFPQSVKALQYALPTATWSRIYSVPFEKPVQQNKRIEQISFNAFDIFYNNS